jgi:hypothetical protein
VSRWIWKTNARQVIAVKHAVQHGKPSMIAEVVKHLRTTLESNA